MYGGVWLLGKVKGRGWTVGLYRVEWRGEKEVEWRRSRNVYVGEILLKNDCRTGGASFSAAG